MAELNKWCANDVSDEECKKCWVKGIIFACPADCEDYEAVWRNKTNEQTTNKSR